MERVLDAEDSYETFSQYLEKHYHSVGHSIIATDCKSSGIEGVMSYSEASARDPIFYRWHNHLEDILQKFRDTKMPTYSRDDFPLRDEIEVVGIKTVLPRHYASTAEDLENILITHNEKAHLVHSQTSEIKYRRINHLPFYYNISILNPKRLTKKVIIRIWLGIPNGVNDARYDFTLNKQQSKVNIFSLF